ncbi:amino acid permease [Desulfobacterota bacterium AH_259_B03_O07]|nr:amino acid permease [Desulfobacterota bacterium AH_259_B03_O07]
MKRRLSGFDATTVVVSDMVGTGIFFTTGWIALNIITGPGIIAAWLTGGILALFGALSYAELSTTFPRSGGEYNYLREAYGPLFGFLSGWTSLFIGFSAPIAIAALGFTAYLSFFWPSLSAENVIFSGLGITLTNASAFALATIITLMFFHFLGRGTDRRVQVFLTVIKIVAIVALILAAVISGKGNTANITSASSEGSFSLTAFVSSIVLITFSYSGWNASTYIAGEIKNPRRNLPLSLLVGTITVAFIYIVINVVYLYALPVDEIKGVGPIAEKAVTTLLGVEGSPYINAVIALSIIGALNTLLFIGPRVLYAMSVDGVFFQFASKVDPRTGIPSGSILSIGSIAAIMVVLGDLRTLLEFAGFVLVVFNFLAVLSVFVLRYKTPNIDRPYRAWGYPVTPAFFCIFSLYLMYASFVFNLHSTMAGIIVVCLGIPFYFFLARRSRSTVS